MEANMATKKPEFDLVLLSGLGHRQYAVPKDAAMAIFELFAGHDVYEIDNEWVGGSIGSRKLAKLVCADQNPQISTLGAVQFHQMLENQRMKEEEEEAKRKAKAND
jgi:hypothetical protein